MDGVEERASGDGDRVCLVPWAEGDLWLLRRTNAPEMTAHLGGPETDEQLVVRHRRYVELEPGRMYRITLADGGGTVGSIGYWQRTWRGAEVWETGWAVLPEFQGRGLAARAPRPNCSPVWRYGAAPARGVPHDVLRPARSRPVCA
ncbi:GNAT family N-acetyltransferase, partial [Streptomyces mutabilis]